MVREGEGKTAEVERGRGEEGLAAWSDAYQAPGFSGPRAGPEAQGDVRAAAGELRGPGEACGLPEGRRMRMQELARKAFLSKSGLSQLFTRLEERGLVERRGDPENLRVTYATITGEGGAGARRADVPRGGRGALRAAPGGRGTRGAEAGDAQDDQGQRRRAPHRRAAGRCMTAARVGFRRGALPGRRPSCKGRCLRSAWPHALHGQGRGARPRLQRRRGRPR